MKAIMIVDDKSENLYLLSSLLSDQYKVAEASNGAEALGLARKSPPDLIIADILMPVMDGFTLCKEWRKDVYLKMVPFVFYTATYTDEKDEKFALSLGADLFLLKPQEPDVLLSEINRLLGSKDGDSPIIKTPEEVTEVVNLREYNQVLIRKLEDKIVDADRSKMEMIKYAHELEKEIVERKTAESAAKKSEERYRTLVENMNEGLVRVDSEDKVLFVNNQFCQMSGYSIDELIGSTGYELLFSEESRSIIIAQNQLRSNGVQGTYEVELRRKDGLETWVKVSGSPVYNDHGVVIGSLGVFENIHERKLIAAQLIQEQQLFQTLAQVSPVGIFRTRPDGYTTYVNPKWSELSGLSVDEAKGFGWLNSVHPEDRQKMEMEWESRIQLKVASTAEYRFLRPDGSIVWVMGNAVPEWNGEEISGYVGTITDVTERKKFEHDLLVAKEKAEAGDRLKTAFMNNISHEVRTPLNGILGFGEMIADPDLTDQEKLYYLEILNASSDRLLKTVNDYMDISLLVSGNQGVSLSQFNLDEVFSQLYYENKLKASARSLNIRVVKPAGSKGSLFNSDATLLKKALSNLVDNAIKFSQEGTIELGYKIEPDRVLFFVKDEGIGIASDKLTQIFEHFMQEDPLTTRKYEGSGLGLSITKGIVELLGGSIWAESQRGSGSTFYFVLPIEILS